MRAAAIPALTLVDWHEADRIFSARRDALVPIAQPMVLITQIQRSGGTLLSSLLDGHPELHAHPWEIQVGHPHKSQWPKLDLAGSSDDWLAMLRQPWLPGTFRTGYVKGPGAFEFSPSAPPVLIAPSFVDGLFRIATRAARPGSSRQVLDAYLTAFFNAWLDYEGLRDAPKRWVTGFCPRLGWGESRARWRADYPDGRMVCVLRDPRAWYLSASHHPKALGSGEPDLMAGWERGAREIAAARADLGDAAFILTYETLVSRPKATMRALAGWLGIRWNPVLLAPTFNRREVAPNSSFALEGGGVRVESRDRWQRDLGAADRDLVEERGLALYERVRALADVP